jgi:very-short-patch-repair endonuclease
VARDAKRRETEGAQGRYSNVAMRSSSHTHKRARALRGDMSPPEVLLWTRLKLLRGEGPRFRRQHPIGPYVADFCCASAKLVIEVDGASHSEDRQIAHDQRRDIYLRQLGYSVLRIPAGQVPHDVDDVVQGIMQAVIAARS